MSPLQQALIHAVLSVVAIVAGVVLAVTGYISGADALAIVLAASGIGGTGVAGTVSAAKAAAVVPKPAQVVTSS